MKILILSDDFPPRVSGGPAVVAAQEAVAYKQAGHDVIVITTVRQASEAGEYDYEGIPVYALHSDYHERWRAWWSLYNPSVIAKLKPLIVRIKPDAVHAHNIHYHLSYHALKLARRAGATVTLTTHDCMLFHYGKFTQFIDEKCMNVPDVFDYHISQWALFRIYKWRYNPFRQAIIKHYLRYCDHICAVSGRHKQALEANGILGTEVVYNGIDPAIWKPSPKANARESESESESRSKKHFGLAPNAKVVAFVGRLSHPKGGDQIVRALAEIVKRVPDAVLLAVGKKDAYGEKMLALAAQLGVVDRIVFTGWIGSEDLLAAYEAADVVAFPSLCFDTFGMVNIEAMALEKPVVATCFGGAAEIVQDGNTGTIVNPLNAGMLSVAVADLLADTKKAQAFGRAGRRRVEKIFTLERSVGHYLSLLSAPNISKISKK